MADPRQRKERLLALLPRIYAAQPGQSAVGALIDSMAASLSRLDDALTRVQYDRWAGLASTVQPEAEDPSALENLGQLLQVHRLPPRVRHAGYEAVGTAALSVRFDPSAPLNEALDELIGAGWRHPRAGQAAPEPAELLSGQFPGLHFELDPDGARLSVRLGDAGTNGDLKRFQSVLEPEPGETFRQRLLVTARVRTRGLTTPRALLSLAIADLGAEPCPRLARQQDSTLAFGMPPGTRKRCAACGGKADTPCPNRAKAVVQAWLTENPSLAATHSESAPRLRRVFTVNNNSLHTDRPVLSLSIKEQPAAYPAIRSVDSGEITLYAGTLKPGETLTLHPRVSPADSAVFDGYDAPGHHAWMAAHPRGVATLTEADGQERDVSHAIFYLWGNRLDDPGSTLGALRCGVLEQQVVTPLLKRGVNNWMLLTFAAPDAEFADADTQVHASRFAGSQDLGGTSFALLDGSIGQGDARYASVLFESFSKTATGSGEESTANAPRLSLELSWMTRPPASFRLRVPKNEWVSAAASRGVLPLLRADVMRASAAGVRALVDFPEPPRREVAVLDAALSVATQQSWQEDSAAAEGALHCAFNSRFDERNSPAEGRFSMQVVFDTTRFNWSHAG